MKARYWLRILVYIKRGVLALESIAKSQAATTEVLVAPTRPRRAPKMAEIHTPSIEEQNVAWQRRLDSEIYGSDIPE